MTGAATMDKPNADLKPGQYIRITEWVRDKAFIRTAWNANVLTTETVAEPGEGTRRNQALFGAVLEVVAIQYPHIIVIVHAISGNADYAKSRMSIDCREFECEPCEPEYVKGMLAAAPPPSIPIVPAAPPSKGHRWGTRALWALVTVWIAVGVARLAMLAMGG